MDINWIQEGMSLLLGNKGESTSSVPLSAQHKYIRTSNMTLTKLQESINLAAIQRTYMSFNRTYHGSNPCVHIVWIKNVDFCNYATYSINQSCLEYTVMEVSRVSEIRQGECHPLKKTNSSLYYKINLSQSLLYNTVHVSFQYATNVIYLSTNSSAK